MVIVKEKKINGFGIWDIVLSCYRFCQFRSSLPQLSSNTYQMKSINSWNLCQHSKNLSRWNLCMFITTTPIEILSLKLIFFETLFFSFTPCYWFQLNSHDNEKSQSFHVSLAHRYLCSKTSICFVQKGGVLDVSKVLLPFFPTYITDRSSKQCAKNKNCWQKRIH